MPEFPPIAHVAVTVMISIEALAGTANCWPPSPFSTRTSRLGGFHHTVFALGGGQLFGLHTHPQAAGDSSTSTAPAWIMFPSPAVTAVSC